jgi:hypothetical protein
MKKTHAFRNSLLSFSLMTHFALCSFACTTNNPGGAARHVDGSAPNAKDALLESTPTDAASPSGVDMAGEAPAAAEAAVPRRMDAPTGGDGSPAEVTSPGDSTAATDPWLGTFSQVAAGDMFACGVRTDGTLACWGMSTRTFNATPPTGTFSQVSAGATHACGLRTDGTVVCWGDDTYGQCDAPTTTFSQVTAGSNHTCGLGTDGAVACWGINGAGESTPPAGTFSQVSTGGHHTCGVRSDGTIACWGNDKSGQADAPTGTFSQVAAGDDHTCGLRTDRTVACWGSDAYGQIDSPTGTFSQVSAGWGYACALRTDGTLACWGNSGGVGHNNAPTGVLSQVSVGSAEACALARDGAALCWGFEVVCVPGSMGCSGPMQLGVCSARGNAWGVPLQGPTTCNNQACVAGSCVGECAPGGVSCDSSSVVTCSADGHRQATICDYGCILNSSGNGTCASSFETCVTSCPSEIWSTSCDSNNVCTSTKVCPLGQVTTCAPRSCSTAGECGTLGTCDRNADGGSVCRSLTDGGVSSSDGSRADAGGG